MTRIGWYGLVGFARFRGMLMKWMPQAEEAIKKVPFFVRKRVRARVEKEAIKAGQQAVSLADVKATQTRYLTRMSSEIKGYQIETCFGPSGCPNRAIISDQLIELIDLRIELESWKASDEQKARRIAELLTIIAELEKRLKELSESCENIVKPLREALTIAEKEIHRQKIEKWVFSILAGAAAGYIGYRIGKSL